MKSFSFFVLPALFLGALAGPVPTDDKYKSPKGKVSIKDLYFYGDCGHYTDVDLAHDGSQISIKFDDLKAKVGPQDSDSEKCKIAFKLHHNKNWSFAFGFAKYEGKVKLEKHVSAKLKSTQEIVGAGYESYEKKFSGQQVASYDKDDNPGNLNWSDCDHDGKDKVIIETEVKVWRPDHKDGSIQHKKSEYQLWWRKCHH